MPHCRRTIRKYNYVAVQSKLLYCTVWMKRLAVVQTEKVTIIALWKASRTSIESDRPLRSHYGSQSASAHGPSALQKKVVIDEM